MFPVELAVIPGGTRSEDRVLLVAALRALAPGHPQVGHVYVDDEGGLIRAVVFVRADDADAALAGLDSVLEHLRASCPIPFRVDGFRLNSV